MTANEVYCEMQKEWVRLTGLKIGDIVQIISDWNEGDQGFINYNNDHTHVGLKSRVVAINPTCIVLSGVNVPYFVLQILDTEKRYAIGQRKIVETLAGIKCGCIELSKYQLSSALAHAQSLFDIFKMHDVKIHIDDTTISDVNIREIAKLFLK